jgi:hypothetical protein
VFSFPVEVLNSKQFARRWRECNRTNDTSFPETKDEDSWRERNLDVLSTAHTLGGIKDLGFELVESHYAVSFKRTLCPLSPIPSLAFPTTGLSIRVGM